MEYQKIANLLDDASSNQPSKFKTKNWVEVNDESRGTYNVKFKTTMLKFSYVITVMYTSLLRELLLLIILLLLLLLLLQIILIKE